MLIVIVNSDLLDLLITRLYIFEVGVRFSVTFTTCVQLSTTIFHDIRAVNLVKIFDVFIGVNKGRPVEPIL